MSIRNLVFTFFDSIFETFDLLGKITNQMLAFVRPNIYLVVLMQPSEIYTLDNSGYNYKFDGFKKAYILFSFSIY